MGKAGQQVREAKKGQFAMSFRSSSNILRAPWRLALAGLLLVAGLFAVIPGSLCAHEGAKGVVKERMMAMEQVGKAMKVITAMIRGEQDHDPVVLAAKARLISAHGGPALTRLFPEGSLETPTEALPEIWADWTRFQVLAQDLTVQGELLARAVEEEAGLPGPARSAGLAPKHQSAQGGNGSDNGRVGPKADLLPPKLAYAKLVRVCAACHKAFRAKK